MLNVFKPGSWCTLSIYHRFFFTSNTWNAPRSHQSHRSRSAFISCSVIRKAQRCRFTFSTVRVFISRAFGASLRNERPAGSGHSASPAAEQGLCCCLAVFTWAKQMVVSSYLCSYTPLVAKAPFFSWRRLANDYRGRCVTLMTSVAQQPTVRQKLILKIQTGSCRLFPRSSLIGSTKHQQIALRSERDVLKDFCLNKLRCFGGGGGWSS